MTEQQQHFTLSRILDPVKRALGRFSGASKPGRSRLEGLEALLVSLGLVLVAALVAVPRPTTPTLLPLPQPDRRTLSRLVERDRTLAEAARQRGLAFEVRAVGEALRRAGAATLPGRGTPANLLGELQSNAARALRDHGPEPLLMLRAVQTELFVRASDEWDGGAEVPAELRELGGDFPELARASGWVVEGRPVFDDDERALLFRARFGELTRLGGKQPFAATLDERKELHAILLRYPTGVDPGARLGSRLRNITALGRIDPDYPAALARGVVLYQSAAYDAAADEFRAELAQRPDGPWHLRAKNHLLAALAQLPAEE